MLISGVTPVAGTMFLFGTLVAMLLSRSALRAPRFGFCNRHGRNRVPSDYGASLD